MLSNHKVYKDPRGLLFSIEFTNVPFLVKRCFFVTDMPLKTNRGLHAHFNTQQYLICLAGSLQVTLIDKKGEQNCLVKQSQSIFIPTLTWNFYCPMEINTTIAVLASTTYDPYDYITDFDHFQSIINAS